MNIPKFDKVFRVLAMKRSGHHAMMEWIVNGLHSNVYYSPNVNEGEKKSYINKIQKVKSIEGCSINTLIYNIEDYDPSRDFSISLPYTTCTSDVLMIREPLSLFSSRWHTKNKLPKNKSNQLIGSNAFSIYQKQFSIIEKVDTFIYYDKWVAKKEYRAFIKEKLGMQSDEYTSDISNFGHPKDFIKNGLTSGFDGKSKDFLDRKKLLNNEFKKTVEKRLGSEIQKCKEMMQS